jgi:signal transduction histidine kinase
MFSGRKAERRVSLARRLTLWYALFFAAASGLVFLSLQMVLDRFLLARVDAELLAQARNYVDLAGRRKPQILQKMFERDARYQGEQRVIFRIFSPEHIEIAAAGCAGWTDEGGALAPSAAAQPGLPVYRTTPGPDRRQRWRLVWLKDEEGRIFQVGESLLSHDSALSAYRLIGGIGLALAIVLGSALSYCTLRRVVRRVEQVQAAAAAIGKGDLATRVPARAGGDAVDSLARAFNEMLDRIAAAVEELKTLSSNVAHDLRRPLARIRGAAELAVTAKPDVAELQQAAGLVVEECDRLDGVIGTLLDIAQIQAGVVRRRKERMDIRRVLSDAVDLFSSVAEEKHIAIRLETPGPEVPFHGDRSAMQRVVANLLDNALKYTPAGGLVSVGCEVAAGWLRIRVADNGMGIAAEDLPRVFDRFFRCERSRSSEGTGLGLSLAQALVKAHGGVITVESAPGTGSTFCVNLPAPSGDSSAS